MGEVRSAISVGGPRRSGFAAFTSDKPVDALMVPRNPAHRGAARLLLELSSFSAVAATKEGDNHGHDTRRFNLDTGAGSRRSTGSAASHRGAGAGSAARREAQSFSRREPQSAQENAAVGPGYVHGPLEPRRSAAASRLLNRRCSQPRHREPDSASNALSGLSNGAVPVFQDIPCPAAMSARERRDAPLPAMSRMHF